jgi:hypothetical protein
MNWQTVATLVVIFSGVAMLHIRTLARRRRTFLLLWLVVGVLVYRWSNYRDSWDATWVAAGLSVAVLLIWWIAIGRRLPPPKDDNIRVWSKDDPF